MSCHLGNGDGDLEKSHRLVEHYLRIYPNVSKYDFIGQFVSMLSYLIRSILSMTNFQTYVDDEVGIRPIRNRQINKIDSFQLSTH
jgi:hypothetical protein